MALAMKIDHIEVINLKYDYPSGQRFRYAAGVCTGRLTTLVLVHTDTGHIGHGSAYSHPILTEIIIKQQLEPFLIGEDPQQIEELWQRMYGLTRWYGRKGVAMTALGAVDTALWDLKGQSLGKPVWAILGGQHGRCPAYASALLWKQPEELAQEAAGFLDRGFRRMKMRIARDPDYDREAVAAVRRAIGTEHDLMVDGSMRFSLAAAQEIGRFLADQNVFWFEEPFAPENHADFKALRGKVGVRLATGENEFGLQGFAQWIDDGLVDIVQPDVSRCGGISEAWKISTAAASRDIPVATHTWSDAVAIIANAHVVVAAPNGLTVEIDQTGNPFVDQLLVEPLRVTEGQLLLTDAPGLGIKLDPNIVERYRIDAMTELSDGSYSDMAFGRAHFSPALPYGNA